MSNHGSGFFFVCCWGDANESYPFFLCAENGFKATGGGRGTTGRYFAENSTLSEGTGTRVRYFTMMDRNWDDAVK
ncbi:hypothetical protein J2Z65_006162 [Paenibacillus aceris]|uniref:Uncharacterized protein n=1 Tax=Paenibacillus aceris TaxID=869555 RepID=A0ABS4I7J6_9BACL|nr:hypothetical protein [Paenibacillus aceris]